MDAREALWREQVNSALAQDSGRELIPSVLSRLTTRLNSLRPTGRRGEFSSTLLTSVKLPKGVGAIRDQREVFG
jgi:hypothetical protein